MADSSDVDNAIVDALLADAPLAALLQAGDAVFIDLAPAGSTAFVIVSLADEQDVDVFEGRAFEDALYLVEVRELSTVPVKHAKAAAARVDVVLQRASLTAAGYGAITLARETRHRHPEHDEIDPSIVWDRRGGHYRAFAPLA